MSVTILNILDLRFSEKLTSIDRFRPNFLENRRMGLSYFLKSASQNIEVLVGRLMWPSCVMLNPEFAGSPIVKDFIFLHPT